MRDHTCKYCKKILPKNRKTYCNRVCMSLGMQQYKTCIICGTRFPAAQTSHRKTCNKSCASENRRYLAHQGVTDKGLEKAKMTIPNHPLTGKFESHVNAKQWVIKSPNGDIYHCRNLMNWLRENEDKLDGTVRQAWVGLANIKLSKMGRIKRNCQTWKGWTVIEWGE